MSCKLKVALRSYWHTGGGRGGGSVVDSVVHRDAFGLPVLPGRHLKGLLREALEQASTFGWSGYAEVATQLFGSRSEANGGSWISPGCLRVSDAVLPSDVSEWLRHTSNRQTHLPRLFRHLYSTAVDTETGTAKERSLRGVEVVVPLDLCARIECVPGREAPSDWPDKIRGVLCLIDAVGAHRTRGLGRAELTLGEA
jgi:CRISPR/Cas system CSM-associated protein Csm3 (group 7 of RAMP superfamily)